jgi:Flp pilus assembly protein CpaB
MEMEFKDNKRKRRVALVAGIGLAVVAGGAAFMLSTPKSSTADPLPTKSVIVAAVPIQRNTVLDASYLAQRQVPIDASNEFAVTDPNMVLGLTTGVVIYPGQVITPNLFTSSDSTRAFAIIKPGESFGPDSPYWRAASVEVEDANAVGGLVKPGDRVDLLASMFVNVIDPEAAAQEGAPVKGGPVTGLSTKIMLTDLEVLAHPAETTTYVLKVDAHQAEEIAYLQGQNPYFRGFALSMRAPGDGRILPRDGYGVTGDRILLKYGFPLEQAIMGDRYPQPSAEPVVLDPTPAPPVEATAQPTLAPAPSSVPAGSPAASVAPDASPAASAAG